MKGPAARVTDLTDHPGVIAPPGAVNVRIGGAFAARVGDSHTCAFPSGPHGPNPIAVGSQSVRIGGMPAARLGDTTACGAHIITGAFNVIIGD